MKIDNVKQIDMLIDNKIIADALQWEKSACEFKGTNNALKLAGGAKTVNSNIVFFGSNSEVKVGLRSKLSGKISLGTECSINIGEDTTVTARLELSAAEGTQISIGNDCMFGLDCRIITHDFHPIFDKSSGARINESADIVIGNHVWIGDGAIIRKGVKIGDGSVIGERAVVLHDIPQDSVAVGMPAKVVKSNIRWERDSLRKSSNPKSHTTLQRSRITQGMICNFEFSNSEIYFFIQDEHDEISKHHIKGSFYEQDELSLISQYVKNTDTILDIGANIGNHAIFFNKIIGNNNIITFEMNEKAQEIAQINYKLNGLSGIISHSGFALGEDDGLGFIENTSEKNLGGARFRPSPDGQVKIIRADTLTFQYSPAFLKIDIEGGELALLKGMRDTIDEFRPKIFIEVDDENKDGFEKWVNDNQYDVVSQYKRYAANTNFMLLPK